MKDNPLFSGKLLARLAYVEKMPEPTNKFNSTYSNQSEDDLLKSCAQLLENNQVEDAWQILYLAKVI